MSLADRARLQVGRLLVRAGRRVLWPRMPGDEKPARSPGASVDEQPWRHPYLTGENIRRFRSFSEGVWEIALRHAAGARRPLRCGFSVNMNQSMYKWARLARKYGAEAALFLNPMDGSAINLPAWEDYDGEFDDILDGARFEHEGKGKHQTDIECHRIDMDGSDFLVRCQRFKAGDRKPLLRLLAETPGLRHEVFLDYTGIYPYYDWARALAGYDVVYTASVAFAAYTSGRPYCAFSVGADLMYDCGRADDYGQAAALSFGGARFLTLTNPHPLAHCRRLGLRNALYLPYPMDDERYCPGPGKARAEWRARCGGEVFVLATARLDSKWKGQDGHFVTTLADAALRCPGLRFVFLVWGESAREFRERVQASDLKDRCLLLPPVGKTRLIDYYRSADVVLDQMVFGYYGATGLEAAAVGRPVIMKLRAEHYGPLYAGDVAPVVNAGAEDLEHVLVALAENRDSREERGRAMRQWLIRNHGERRTVPLMLAVLRMAADHVPLPPDLISPLRDEETEEERAYHATCVEVRR